jgi:hypothetical protein
MESMPGVLKSFNKFGHVRIIGSYSIPYSSKMLLSSLYCNQVTNKTNKICPRRTQSQTITITLLLTLCPASVHSPIVQADKKELFLTVHVYLAEYWL